MCKGSGHRQCLGNDTKPQYVAHQRSKGTNSPSSTTIYEGFSSKLLKHDAGLHLENRQPGSTQVLINCHQAVELNSTSSYSSGLETPSATHCLQWVWDIDSQKGMDSRILGLHAKLGEGAKYRFGGPSFVGFLVTWTPPSTCGQSKY